MAVFIFILKCLLAILILLLLLLCSLLFIPFNYIFSGYINYDISLNGNVKWLFGLIKISTKFNNGNLKLILTICKINFNISNFVNKHKLSNKPKSNKIRKHFSINNFINSIYSNYKKFKDILTLMKPNFFNINGYFGFNDPCLTGQLTAISSTCIHNTNINLIPVFDKEILDIDAKINGNIHGYLICYIFLKYLLKNKFKFFSIKKKFFNNKKCIN